MKKSHLIILVLVFAGLLIADIYYDGYIRNNPEYGIILIVLVFLLVIVGLRARKKKQ